VEKLRSGTDVLIKIEPHSRLGSKPDTESARHAARLLVKGIVTVDEFVAAKGFETRRKQQRAARSAQLIQ
jgi:hypothetical protein